MRQAYRGAAAVTADAAVGDPVIARFVAGVTGYITTDINGDRANRACEGGC
jgi:hypothetical protein